MLKIIFTGNGLVGVENTQKFVYTKGGVTNQSLSP